MTGNPDDMVTLREALRRDAIAKREAMTESARQGLTRRLEYHLGDLIAALAPACLAFCWPYRAEPDLRHFMASWLSAASGRTAALPVVVGRDQALVFRAWTPATPLLPDRYGIPHPPDGPELQPDAVLVPLNAFDAAGYRIGYGGGYFDRTLAEQSLPAIGVGFEVGRVDDTLPQPHDQAMQWIVTEAGMWRTSAAQLPR